ncbi:MAG: sodium:proton antiporter [Verrucomicrobiota bacterium]
METFDITAILITLAAAFAYLNYRYIKLPTTIGIMLMSLVVALLIILFGSSSGFLTNTAHQIIAGIDFNEVLMEGMLCFLLFAGALHVNLNDLANQKFIILLMATIGVIISTAIVGLGSFYLLQTLSLNIPLIHCLLFGALISPTDPVAVLGILKKAGVPKSLETKITGESLFNDGVGVVVFITILKVATHQEELSTHLILHEFAVEALGGIAFGIALGAIGFYLIKSIDNYQVEVLITLAIVTGGYSLAMALHISGPLAMVVAGLMIGNHGRSLAMSQATRKRLDVFWELVDEVLNAVLFVLIGLELLIVQWTPTALVAGLLAIPLVLAARLIAVTTPVGFLRFFRPFEPGTVRMLTWGGLRGGISVALVLALPQNPERDLFLTMTYLVVVFSIAVQGLTLKRLAHSIQKDSSPPAPTPP